MASTLGHQDGQEGHANFGPEGRGVLRGDGDLLRRVDQHPRLRQNGGPPRQKSSRFSSQSGTFAIIKRLVDCSGLSRRTPVR
jgi:hypothetical protein